MKALNISRMRLLFGLMTVGLLSGLVIGIVLSAVPAVAQTAGQGGLQGTVTDPSGAVVPSAAVTATDRESGVATARVTSSAGFYTIAPLIPGTYSVSVSAKGFKINTHQNIVVNGYGVTGLDVKLSVGSESQTVVVNTAPPELNTTNATLGGVIDTKTYDSLPVLMNNQQRDPTAVATLLPGAEGGPRAPIMAGTGGSGGYVSEVYVDGIPTTTANMQSDNRIVSLSMPIESVDQVQVMSSNPSAEYQGAGALAFTTKSGGNHYHGTVADFIRNTIFDTWGFGAPAATVVNAQGENVPAGKPVEHQNEFVASVGGPIPFTRHKGFFFMSYDKFRSRKGVSPSITTLPTALMKQGNFSELLGTDKNGNATGQIYDPLTTQACSANSTNGPCRYQYGYGYGGTPGPNGNPVLNGLPVNVIPASEISPLSQYEQKFLPDPTLPGIASNYLMGGGSVSGFNDWEIVGKVDWVASARQRVSVTYTHGDRKSIGFGDTLPMPYSTGTISNIFPTEVSIEHSYVFTPKLINQFTYGFTRFPQPQTAATDNVKPYRAAADIGIGNLPPGQASDLFPATTFSNTTAFPTAIATWTGNGGSYETQFTVPTTFTIVDNLQWNKGRHAMTFGFQTQWLQDNVARPAGPSGIYQQGFTANSTAPFAGTGLSSTSDGFSYASFLLGAVNSGATGIQAFDETGGRYHPWSPYFQDNFKVTPKLTLNLGLRWDYLPPTHEVLDRFSFFNPNATDPLTGTPGELQFAGHRGADISCQCRTPARTYWKNWGPRLGFEYAPNARTVFSGGWSITYSRAGGVGGRGGDSQATGQDGFNANLVLPPAVNTGVGAGPSYYLNNSAAFKAAGMDNVNFGGPGFVLPTPIQPAAPALVFGIGNYVSNGKYVTASGAPPYIDPYLSGRAPEFVFYNFGMQRALTDNITVQATYSGSQSHFVGGTTVPGFWSGQLNTSYIVPLASVVANDGVSPILSSNAPATPANIAIAQKALPGITVPYPSYVQTQTGNANNTATITRMLRPYPKYSGPPSPEWDNVGNVAYNALQFTLKQRAWKGLNYNLNYTYSKDIQNNGDPSAWPVPAELSSNGVALPGNNRANRLEVLGRQTLNIFGLDELPFGRGKIGGNNFVVRTLAGGWSISGLFTYHSGAPYTIAASGCTTPELACRPDLDPSYSGPIRINGSYGKGLTAANMKATRFLNKDAFKFPNTFPAGPTTPTANLINKLGDAPAGLGLFGPGKYDIDLSLRRSFNLSPERWKFIFEADCTNITNKNTFNTPNGTWSSVLLNLKTASSSAFGQISGSSGNRDFQFSGRITF